MKKAFVLLAVIFTITLSPPQDVQACESTATVQMNKEKAVEPKADVIVRKYRIINGVALIGWKS